jgi:subtilase family serine protease
MRLAKSPAQVRNLSSNGRLSVEHLEDRLVPGETLTGLLLLPMGLSPLDAPLTQETRMADDPASTTVVDGSASSSNFDRFLLDTDEDSGPDGALPLLDGSETVRQPSHEQAGSVPASGSTTEPLFPSEVPDLDSPFDLQLFGSARASMARYLPAVSFSDGSPNGTVASAVPFDGINASAVSTAIAGAISQNSAAPVAEAASSGGAAVPLLIVKPQASSSPSGLSPSTIKTVYGFNKLSQTGAGQTIALVDAYDDPTIQADLDTFSTQFGLPTTGSGSFTFTKATPQGTPRTDGGWALEISLDVEWAHAVAPQANILLVEAQTSSFTNLLGAVDYAVGQGAHTVSMSWGGTEFSAESNYDSHFNVPGVMLLASAGDSGGVVNYPSASPYVVSVGGTMLDFNRSGTFSGETAWASGGGGASAYEPEPGYQTAYGISLSGRGTPDVSYDADPNSGVSVYDTTRYHGQTGWWQVGGTSAGAPQWAGLVALADQSRATPLTSANLISSPLYSAATGSVNYASNFRDITSGSNGYPATIGYDLATGLGSPLANSLVPYLAKA